MPRPAADRAFGFKAPGLVRILLAADPEELLKALEELGLVAKAPESISAIIEGVVGELLGPVVQAIDVTSAVRSVIDRALSALISAANRTFIPEGAQLEPDLRAAIASLEKTRLELAREKRAFEKRLATQKQTEEDVAITFL